MAWGESFTDNLLVEELIGRSSQMIMQVASFVTCSRRLSGWEKKCCNLLVNCAFALFTFCFYFFSVQGVATLL